MKKYRVEEVYLTKVWKKKIYECYATCEDDVYSGEIEEEKIISEEIIEEEHEGNSEFEDLYEINQDGSKIG